MIIFRIIMLLLAVMPMIGKIEAGVLDTLSDYLIKPQTLPPPMIRVLIAHDKPGVTLEVVGKYHIFDPHAREHISTRFVGKRKTIQPVEGGLKWGEEFPGIHQIKIVPDRLATLLIDGVEYHGAIYVYNIGGSISLVNEIYVEDYLNAILAGRYSEEPREVQAAIAIADRTHAYYLISHPKNKFWDVDGEKSGYRGYVAKQNQSSIEDAILATRYMIMSQKNEGVGALSPFPAYWCEESKGAKNAVVTSRISLGQAGEMAKRGDHAAQILSKAFPGISIQFIQHASLPK